MINPKNEEFLKMIGTNVRKIRTENDITMDSLSFETGIEYRQIGRIERGEVNTTVMSLYRIAKILKTDIRNFFDDNQLSQKID
ncbi:MAG TPA: helix-turn-helix transcriptional regulator [Sediminibacterium sp.]|jgi:transcriptional regulator with XRE-family HTH domain|nr:helix-turn-helix transcriptional regulator [Sediminibacterium sp.]HQS56670.1 helix-turn-helix transcriptional regulator [Sediminibacterium sp.]